MDNFTNEQEFLKTTAANLLMFVHQREQSYNLRKISISIGVSNNNAKAVMSVIDALNIDNDSFSTKMEAQLKKSISICQSQRQLKGNDITEYFKETLQIVTKSSQRVCIECGDKLSEQNRKAKAKFCSSKCRVSNFRTKNKIK
jgi:hypothetical protein